MDTEDHLPYYKDPDVPRFVTCGISRKLPDIVVGLLYWELYNYANDIRRAGGRVDYLTVIKIESKRINHGLCSYHYTMSQESTTVVKSDTKVLPVNKIFNGTIWAIETWNGNPKPKIPDEHYLMLLFPSEY